MTNIAVVRGSDSQLYLAKASGQLGDPIDYQTNGQWEIWIPKGEQGLQGEKGDKGDTGDQGIPGSGVAGNHDLGVIYLKNNTTETTIPSLNARAVVAGTMQTGTLFNFEKDATTNSLKYTGDGGRFHVVATFNFYSGSNNTCGFYIGKNTNPASALDPNADRISESEIYANAVSQTKPSATAIQTVLDLNPGDRIFFIVQNKDSTSSITVEFLKFVAVTLTAEKGDIGPEGPPVDTSTLVPYSGATGNVDLGVYDLEAGNIYSNGNTVATVVDPVRTTLNGNGTLSTFAISGASGLVNPSALIVAIDGILQEPSVDYTVDGGNITFTSPLPSGSKAVVVSPTNTLQVLNMIPADGSVTSAKLVPSLTIETPTINGATISQATLSNIQPDSLADIVRRRGNGEVIPCVHFDDFFGTNSLTSTFSNTFSFPSESYPNAFGVVRMATTTALDSRGGGVIQFWNPSAVGMEYSYCFAIGNVTNIEFAAGSGWGTSYFGLYYISGQNSNRFVLKGQNGQIIDFSPNHTVQAGDFISGTKYKLVLRYNSATQAYVKLESAAFNSSTWTTIYNNNVGLNSGFVPGGSNVTCFIGMRTLAAGEQKFVFCDWISFRHSGISR